MSNKKAIQTGLVILTLLLLVVGTSVNAALGSYFTIAALSLLAAVCIWYGIDYFKLKKKYLGGVMIGVAIAAIYIIFATFIEPLLK